MPDQAIYYTFVSIIYTNSHSNCVRHKPYSSHFNFQNLGLEEVL